VAVGDKVKFIKNDQIDQKGSSWFTDGQVMYQMKQDGVLHKLSTHDFDYEDIDIELENRFFIPHSKYEEDVWKNQFDEFADDEGNITGEKAREAIQKLV
jgi:hypothetical protein